MEPIAVNGAMLDVECRGAGPPIVFVHGASVADSFRPMMDKPALGDHQLIRYHRRGYSTGTDRASIPEHAADCAALLDALDVGPAHVVGHSLGGSVALQMAVDAPTSVRSLVVLEPAGMPVAGRASVGVALGLAQRAYVAGQRRAAVDGLWVAVGGRADWRDEMTHTLPEGPVQADRNAAGTFESGLPALAAWRFDAAQAATIDRPALYLLGADSLPFFADGRDLLRSWLPRMDDDVVPGANHLLQIRRPGEVAGLIAGFLARRSV